MERFQLSRHLIYQFTESFYLVRVEHQNYEHQTSQTSTTSKFELFEHVLRFWDRTSNNRKSKAVQKRSMNIDIEHRTFPNIISWPKTKHRTPKKTKHRNSNSVQLQPNSNTTLLDLHFNYLSWHRINWSIDVFRL